MSSLDLLNTWFYKNSFFPSRKPISRTLDLLNNWFNNTSIFPSKNHSHIDWLIDSFTHLFCHWQRKNTTPIYTKIDNTILKKNIGTILSKLAEKLKLNLQNLHSVEIIHHKKQNFSKNRTFSVVNPCFFLELFSVKMRLEIMFNNVLDTKETFFGHKKCNPFKSQKSHFSKGVNPCFWSKNVVFFLSCFRSK